MRRNAAPLLIALLVGPGAGIAQADPTPIRIERFAAPYPAHCLSAKQGEDPVKYSPLAALDGDERTGWWLCPAAEKSDGYSIEFQFAAPVSLDAIRVVLDPPVDEPPETGAPAAKRKAAAPAPTHGRPTRLEFALYDSTLSKRIPVLTRTLLPAEGRSAHELALSPPLKWNPKLIDDEDFGAARRTRNLGEFLPAPLTIDRLSFIVRAVAPGDAPVRFQEIGFRLGGQPVPVAGLDEAAEKHRAFITRGLKHIFDGRWLRHDKRALQFETGGALWSVDAAAFDAGQADKKKKRAGTWALDGGRLMFTPAGTRVARAVGYFLDDAPRRVVLEDAAIAGEYRVVSRAPGGPADTAPAPPPPSLGSEPGAEPPPLLE
jgi:hypothetical protein